jgi:hypothetical protein
VFHQDKAFRWLLAVVVLADFELQIIGKQGRRVNQAAWQFLEPLIRPKEEGVVVVAPSVITAAQEVQVVAELLVEMSEQGAAQAQPQFLDSPFTQMVEQLVLAVAVAAEAQAAIQQQVMAVAVEQFGM